MGSRGSMTSIATEMTTMLDTVPRPGRSRIGIQASSTAALMTNVASPMDSWECRDRSRVRTVYGELPSRASSSSASPVPKSHRADQQHDSGHRPPSRVCRPGQPRELPGAPSVTARQPSTGRA